MPYCVQMCDWYFFSFHFASWRVCMCHIRWVFLRNVLFSFFLRICVCALKTLIDRLLSINRSMLFFLCGCANRLDGCERRLCGEWVEGQYLRNSKILSNDWLHRAWWSQYSFSNSRWLPVIINSVLFHNDAFYYQEPFIWSFGWGNCNESTWPTSFDVNSNTFSYEFLCWSNFRWCNKCSC